MKKIITTTLIGFLLTCFMYIAMAWTINHVNLSGKRAACWINPQFQRKGGQEWRLTQDWPLLDRYDVIVYGSSHAYRGYDPRIFESSGMKLFAAGSGFQNILASYFLSKYEFPPQPGTLIIIDLFDQTFEGDGFGSFTRIIENAGHDATANAILRANPRIMLLNSWMCRQFSKSAAIEIPDEEGYLKFGYCPKSDTLKSDPKPIKTDRIEFNPTFALFLERMILEYKSAGFKVVLVSHPQPKTDSYRIYHESFLNFISPVINSTGVHYLDYNTKHDLRNHEHFADANHLNQAGVSLFNAKLITDLHHLGLIHTSK